MQRVIVVGAGQMGGGIAQVCAAADLVVTLVDVGEEHLARGVAAIEKSLGRLAEKGGRAPDDVLANLSTSTTIPEGSGADVAIEAVIEDEHIKGRRSR